MNVRLIFSLATAATLACLTACSGKTTPATQLLVTIDSDIEVGTTLARVDAEVLDAKGKQIDTHTFKLTTGGAGKSEAALPFSFGIEKHSSQSLRLLVTGYGPDDTGDAMAIVQQAVNATFQSGKTTKLKVFLSVLCANTTCDADETCYAAAEGGTAAGDCGPVPGSDGGSNLVDAGSNDNVDAGELTAAGGASGGGGSAGRAGSSDAHAGTSGSAAAGGCTASCVSKQCGDDGCGGQCGTCKSTETCQSGACVCVPACNGKQCGADGCGGQCGTCSGTQTCRNGTCSCVPDCTGKECGADGCGGTCDPGCNAGVGECVSGTCELTCDATSTACSCDAPPSDAAVGNIYADSDCASGLAVFRTCMNNGVPLTCSGSGLQWGETCYCPTN